MEIFTPDLLVQSYNWKTAKTRTNYNLLQGASECVLQKKGYVKFVTLAFQIQHEKERWLCQNDIALVIQIPCHFIFFLEKDVVSYRNMTMCDTDG